MGEASTRAGLVVRFAEDFRGFVFAAVLCSLTSAVSKILIA